ncbi:MAG: hypothetical protein LBG83_01020 [Oscillospiraceae bacterium]|jgi:hypothetical protein|nr:hypothetical protein [Oscillospiraceae bacterium]
MLALCLILGFFALIVGLLCAPVIVRAEYDKKLTAKARWLFLEFALIPGAEKKPKKKKQEKQEEEKPKEEKPKKEGPGALQRFYQNQGIPGFVELLERTVEALKKFRHGLWLCLKIRELRLLMVIQGGEPDKLIEKYGKTCAAVFPSLGWLASHLRTKKGCVRAQITPDFTGFAEKELAAAAELSVCPLLLLGALIALLARLGIKVLLKFLNGAKQPPKKQKAASGS